MKRTKRTSSINQHKAHKTTVRISVGSESSKVLWIFDKIDRDGLFAFNINRSDFDHKGFLDKLISYSSMTWAEVIRQTHDAGKSKHHFLADVDRFSNEAIERINKLRLNEDTDRIFSFAFTNLLRIIGLREAEKFYVIWYDAYHQFYPVQK